MAETLTIGGVNRTANIHGDSLTIEQVAGEFSAVCSVKLNDLDATLAIETRDPVTVVDNGTTLFGGEVADIDADLLSLALGGRRLAVQCRDYQILVEEAVIDAEEAYAAQADSAIIDDLFSTYRADIDSTTYVSTLQASMTISFADVTLREALNEICGRTGGRWYVDEGKALHYFAAEANVAGWFLSDTPDLASSFPYQHIAEHVSGLPIVNRFLTVGKGVRGWRQDNASIAAYGTRPAVGIDSRITTTAGVEERGDAILAKYAYPRVGYAVTTRKEGLRAGMDVRLVCGAWGVDETLTVRRLVIRWRAGVRFYELELGEGFAQALTKGRIWLDRIGQVESTATSLDGAVFDVDAPAAPAALGAGNVTTGVSLDADGAQIVWAEITWGSVADADLDHYELQLSRQSDFTSDVETRRIAKDADRVQRFVGLIGNTTYYVRVRAEDWVGNDSAWDYGGGSAYSFTTAKDTEAPAQVAGLAAGSSRTLVGLYWTANAEADLLHYEIQRAPDVTGAPGAWATIALADLNFYTDQDFTDGEIAAQDTFWYRVRAVDRSQNAGTWATQTSVALGQITHDHIAALTIVGDNIAGNTIVAGKLNVGQLSAISADLGTCTAGTVTGATVRTAAAGARVVLDSTDGIRVFNASAVLTAQLDVDGSGQLGSSDYEPIVWNAAGQLDKLKANQLDIGDSGIFSDNGRLLLGPGCELTATSWKSLRGQVATIANAFQTKAGAFPGAQGIVMEPGTTNFCYNGAMRDDDSNDLADLWTLMNSGGGTPTVDVLEHPDPVKGWLQKLTYVAVGGDSGEYIGYSYITAAASFAEGDDVTVSIDIRGSNVGTTMRLYVAARDVGNNVLSSGYTDITLVGGLRREYVTLESLPATTDHVRVIIYAVNVDQGDSVSFTFGAVNCEKRDGPTTFCSGQLPWCAWSGAAYASTSTRTATTLGIATAGNISASTGSLSIRFRLLTQYNREGSAVGLLFNAGNAAGEFEAYVTSAGAVRLRINGATRCEHVGPLALDQDHQAVFEWDAAGDDSWLYVDGVLAASGTCGGSAPTLGSSLQLGYSSFFGTSANLCGIITEVAVLGDLLTAAEVAAMWNLRRPMIDHGAVDSPGIYVTDGKFRISSSYTGTRIEITAEEIAGYNGATKQFYLSAEDGKAYAGGDVVALNDDGIEIEASTAFADSRSYKFKDSSGDIVARVGAVHDEAVDDYRSVDIRTLPHAGLNSIAWVVSESPEGNGCQANVWATHDRESYDHEAFLSLNTDAANKSNIWWTIDSAWMGEIQDGKTYLNLPPASSTNNNVQISDTQEITYYTSVRAAKTNIRSFSGDRHGFMALKPMIYNAIERPDGPPMIGLIAEDVAETFPTLATYMQKNSRCRGDKQRQSKSPEPPELALSGWDTNQMLVMMVSVVQQQEADLKALQARLAALEVK